MSFSDHKITQFTHRISELADQPNLPADELKARFDACPEELRTAHNAVCDDAAILESKVENIITETFDGVIEKSMLSGSLAAELDAKAVESSVASRIAAEQTARESADSSLQSQLSSQISSVNNTVAQKCRIFTGSYTGNDTYGRTISLGVTPKALIMAPFSGQSMVMMLQGTTCTNSSADVATLSGSKVTIHNTNALNQDGRTVVWLALV